jgi:hypothetical protein
MLETEVEVRRADRRNGRLPELAINIAPVQRGTILVRHLESDPLQNYLLYLPKAPSGPQRLLFMLVRGETDSALERAHHLSELAREFGVVLVAPVFERLPPLGSLAQERRRVHQTLVRILREVAMVAGVRTRRLSLFGCGAAVELTRQFCVGHASWVARMALALPTSREFGAPLADSPLPTPVLPSLGKRDASGHADSIPTLVLVGNGHRSGAEGQRNQLWLGSTEPMGARLAVTSRFSVTPGGDTDGGKQQALTAMVFRWLFANGRCGHPTATM